MQPALEDRIATVAHVAAAHAADVDRDGTFPQHSVAALADAGLLGITLPPDVGGLGLGPREFLQAVRAVAGACASSAMVFLMHVCASKVAQEGGASDAVLRGMASDRLSTLAFSEKGSRSHFWAPLSEIQGSNGDGRLAAQKSFVTSAGHAATYIVSTRPAGADPLRSSLYVVDAGAEGVETSGAWVGLGLRGNASAPMTFSTPVGKLELLGEEGQGLDLMLGVVLPWFQLGQGAVSLGIAEGALKIAVGHVTTARLEHLGQTVADLPTVRARLGRSQTEVDALAGFLTDLAGRMAEGDATAPVLSAKAFANETAIRVTSDAMQACGGAAMSPALGLERFFRDARAGSVMAPTTDVLYELTGRAMAGMPLLG
ncbi:MAG TPA: acyl-CoA dehydrogenase family protein [Actinomycetota bacterium]|nr:acyl-CoA dehydrogenase family protein [Actinomycetota bacterium]